MKNHQEPPRWTELVLKSRISEEASEDVLGDLQELYDQWIKAHGVRRAWTLYVLHAFGFLQAHHAPSRKLKDAIEAAYFFTITQRFKKL
jgi:hypothetical protein